MNRSADDIGQIIAGIQRDLEELKSNQGRSPIPDDSVTTAKIVDAAVTSAKIDWSTVIHGTSPASGTINTNSGTSISVTIPTQANTNYKVIITETESSGAWSWIASRVNNKTTTGFTIDLYNNSAQWTATSMAFDYLVIPGE
jgi:hypothetical protein